MLKYTFSSRLVRTGIAASLALAVVGGAGAVVARAQDAAGEEKQAETPATTQKVQPVNFRVLKEWLPAELAGLKRTNAQGEKMAFGELNTTLANADYKKENDESDNPPSGRIEVTDYGATPQMAEMLAMFSKVEIDRESDTGFDRTVKYGDKHAAQETWNSESKHGQIQVYVANRFILQVTVDNVTEEQFKEIGPKLPLDKLAELK